MNRAVGTGRGLPFEIFDKIIDLVAKDTKTLIKCSLVSRAFYDHTRFYLLYTFRVCPVLQSAALAQLVDFWDTSPHLPTYIHTFHFSTVFLTEHDAPRVLYHLRSVKDAFMNDLVFDHFEHREAVEALAALPIQTLTINKSAFPSFHDFSFVIRCFPLLRSLHLFGASISATTTVTPWINSLPQCSPPRIEHLTITARSIDTRKSNTRLFSEFPAPPFDDNQPFRIDNLKRLEVRCANQTDIIRIGRFLPRVKRTLKSLSIIRVDNGVSSRGQPMPWVLGLPPLDLESIEDLTIDVGFKVRSYADYLLWWISNLSTAKAIRSITIRIAMALEYIHKEEDKQWQNVWHAFGLAMLGKESLQKVLVEFQIPSSPRNFFTRKRGVERECRDLVERGVMRVVVPNKARLVAF